MPISLLRRFSILLLVGLPLAAASAPGIKNFEQVDSRVFRGAQPTEEGFGYLAKAGVKTVIDLREADDRSAEEGKIVTGLGMTYVNVPMTGLTPPSNAEIIRILAVLEDTNPGSVFVHCKRGADRTGAVIAAYHIDHDGWDNAKALKDAKRHDMSGFQIPRQKFISDFRPLAVGGKVVVAAGASPATDVPVTKVSAEPEPI